MRSLANYFGAAFLVNLPERVDRLRSARRELSRAGLSIGADGVAVFAACRFDDPAGFINAGTRGCFHSHLECFRRAPAESRGVLMFEDDIALTSAMPALTPAILSRLDADDWDFVYFGHEATGDIARASTGPLASDVTFTPYVGEIYTTHFYGVNRAIIPRLIAHLDTLAAGTAGDNDNGPMPLDGAYNVFRRRNPDVRCLIARPKLGWQRPSRSDIMPKAIDASAVARPVMRALREIKHIANRWRP